MTQEGKSEYRNPKSDFDIRVSNFCFMDQTALATRQEQALTTTQDQEGGLPVTTADILSQETQQVCFMLAGGEYGVDISLVKEIIKPTMEPTPVPQSPFFVEGVIDLRGDIIPIIDLKKRFGIEDITKPTRILVIQIADIIAGFLVDSVTEVVRTTRNKIQDAPGKVVGVDTEFIWGVTKRSSDSPLIMLLDIERILKLEEGESVGGET
jgi:purine-binding chemotaxis protein CheW